MIFVSTIAMHWLFVLIISGSHQQRDRVQQCTTSEHTGDNGNTDYLEGGDVGDDDDDGGRDENHDSDTYAGDHGVGVEQDGGDIGDTYDI